MRGLYKVFMFKTSQFIIDNYEIELSKIIATPIRSKKAYWEEWILHDEFHKFLCHKIDEQNGCDVLQDFHDNKLLPIIDKVCSHYPVKNEFMGFMETTYWETPCGNIRKS